MKRETKIAAAACGGLAWALAGYWVVSPAKWLLVALLGQSLAFWGAAFLAAYGLGISAWSIRRPRRDNAMGASELLAIAGVLLLLLAQWPMPQAAKLFVFSLAALLCAGSLYRKIASE